MTLNGVLVDRANEIRKQKGTLGGGMVMSAYDARELPAVLALYGVESSAGFEGQGILVESLSKASMKPVILLHQGHFTVCLKAEPWTVYRDPANQYDQSAELEFMDSWGLTPDLVKGKIYALGGQGKVLYYRGSWITNAWVVKVT